MMGYKKFYVTARRYAERKITRGEFCAAWEYCQRQQGLAPGKPGGLKTAAPA
jgi:hypothetical protein